MLTALLITGWIVGAVLTAYFMGSNDKIKADGIENYIIFLIWFALMPALLPYYAVLFFNAWGARTARKRRGG